MAKGLVAGVQFFAGIFDLLAFFKLRGLFPWERWS
jgi:hypothetical protein